MNETNKYLDTSFDQGDSLLNKSNDGNRFVGLEPIRPPLGERVVPGQGGFRLADTPQAWVFIHKKEWMDETWTYVVNDRKVDITDSYGVQKSINIDEISAELETLRSDLTRLKQEIALGVSDSYRNSIKADIQTTQEKIQSLEKSLSAAREQVAKNGGQLQVDGKLAQIDIRSALGNIITRKLDWMNDHEKFTKVTAPVSQWVDAIQFNKLRAQLQDTLINIEGELSGVEKNIKSLTAINNILNGQMKALQQFINESLSTIGDITDPKEREEVLAQIAILQQQLKDGQNTIQINQQRIDELEVRKSTIINENILYRATGQKDPSYDEETSLLYAPVTLSGTAFTRYYQSPTFKNRSTTEIKELEIELKVALNSLEKETKALVEQTRTAPTPDSQEKLFQKQRQYIETRRTLEKIQDRLSQSKTGAPIEIDVGKQVFNGVMELANVSQISTTVSLDGEGSASFTIENPQNIFFISHDDVDLALTEDPFLERDRVIRDTVYYRGRFYPQHIVEMILSRKGGAVNIGHLAAVATVNEELDRKIELKARIEALNKEIAELNTQIDAAIRIDTGLRYRGNVSSSTLDTGLLNKRATLIVTHDNLDNELKSLETNIDAQTNNQIQGDKNRENDKKQQRMGLIRQTLLKYYAGKTIFQVLDRVYIWMTSPTRTLFRLNRSGTDRYAIEDPSAILMAQQLTAAEQREILIRNELSGLTQQLSVVGVSMAQFQENPSVNLVPSDIPPFIVNENLLGFAGNIKYLNAQQIVAYWIKLTSELSTIQGTIDMLRRQIKSTDSVTSSSTFNRIPSSTDSGATTYEQQQIVGNYESRYLGLQEERLQVFQGIISTVKQTYSDGKYQLQVTCKDNMTFLSMSRIMVKPALRADQGPRGILQDPIWRNNELAGNWKNGILVASFAFVNDEVLTRLNKKVTVDANIKDNLRETQTVGSTAGRNAVSPYVTSLPFASIDAADLVSFVITGLPYNFSNFIKNASFGGRLLLDKKSGTTDQRSNTTSFFTYLKRQIGDLNDRLGDFEPYIDFGEDSFDLNVLRKKNKSVSKDLAVSTEILTKAYQSYLISRMVRYFQRIESSSIQKDALDTKDFKEADQAPPTINADRLASMARLASAYSTSEKFSEEIKKFPQLLDKFTHTVVSTATRASLNDTINLDSLVGQVAASDAEIEDIVKMFLSANTQLLGPFNVVVEIIQVQSGKKLGDSRVAEVLQSPNTSSNSSNKPDPRDISVKQAIKEFVKELLTIQSDFADEYSKVVAISANANDLKTLMPELEQFRINLDKNPALKASIKDGPKSTVEKIVRGEKKNFLIISDRYQLDGAIQAYQTMIAKNDFALFQSEWETPLSVCKRAAEQVDFEFYADEDGNLQFKPPTYNRILKEHFGLISETDALVRDAILIQYGGTDGQILQAILRAILVLSEYRVEVSQKRIGVRNELGALEIGAQKAKTATQKQIDSTNPTSLTENIPGQSGGASSKISNTKLGYAASTISYYGNLLSAVPFAATITIEQEAKECIKSLRSVETGTLAEIETRARTDKNNRIAPLEIQMSEQKQIASDNSKSPSVREEATNKVRGLQAQINEITTSINKVRLEQQLALYDNMIGKDKVVGKLPLIIENVNKLREQIRQKAITFVDSLSRFMDEQRIHRVCDYDLFSYDVTEAPPRFTYLEVQGTPDLVEIRPTEYYWAGGVDYDNWRHYGFLSENMQKAYFHSGDTARTYLRAMLGRERGRVLTGSVTVRGDSKYKVGDCIFLESVGMYFYITSTSHSFSYGQSYTTSLTLAYGRRIGELIPHPFDVLGKVMIDTYQIDIEEKLAREKYIDENGNVATNLPGSGLSNEKQAVASSALPGRIGQPPRR